VLPCEYYRPTRLKGQGARPPPCPRLRRLGIAAGVGFASWLLASAAWAQAEDPLVSALVRKGVLTAEEARRLQGPTGFTERDALTKLLQAKGLLTADDVAHLEAEASPIQRIPAPPAGETPVYTHKDAPTSLSVGPVDLTLGGFIDYEAVYRTRNNEAVGSSFGTIPFSNSTEGHVSEFRSTAQNTRITLKAAGGGPIAGQQTDFAAYVEGDFFGNDAASVGISSNSDTFRLRQAFVDIKRGSLELLAGQAWSWLTPNRRGLGSYPSDVFLPGDLDPNYNVGFTWVRQPTLRLIFHPDSHWALGVSIENPDQFGGYAQTTFPAAFNEQLAAQVGLGAGGSSIPDAAPDIIPKVSFDSAVAGHPIHVEAAGLASFFRVSDKLAGGGYTTHTAAGFGGELAGNFELIPGKLTAVASGFASSGGGRYIFALAPDIVVLPNASGTDVFISPVRSYAGLFGVEWSATTKLKLSGYWGFAKTGRDYARDTSTGAASGAFVGFGYPGSPDNNNRWLNEGSVILTYTAWNSPKFGSLQFGMQYSYVEREPWFVAPNAPSSASLNQFWWDVRYIFP
jgi:hypothetical protein